RRDASFVRNGVQDAAPPWGARSAPTSRPTTADRHPDRAVARAAVIVADNEDPRCRGHRGPGLERPLRPRALPRRRHGDLLWRPQGELPRLPELPAQRAAAVRAGQPRRGLRRAAAGRLRRPRRPRAARRRAADRRARGLPLVRRQGGRVRRPGDGAESGRARREDPPGRGRRRDRRARAADVPRWRSAAGRRPGARRVLRVPAADRAPPAEAVPARPHPPRLRPEQARAADREDASDRLLRRLPDHAVVRPRRKNGVSTTRAATSLPRISTPISVPTTAASGGTKAKPTFLPRLGAKEPLVTTPTGRPPT